MRKAVFFNNTERNIDYVYGDKRIARIKEVYDLYPVVVTPDNITRHIDKLQDAEYIFSTWGMFAPAEELLDRMPKLKAVFYAAGSVKYFAEPFLKRGIAVSTAAQANGEFVTDLAYGQVLMAGSGYFHCFCTEGYTPQPGEPGKPACPGFFDIQVGLIGAGFIGRQMIARLHTHPGITIAIYDPYVSDAEAARLGVTKMTLEELFRTSQVVSNHAPNIPETEHMLREAHFLSMPANAAFINTGRGMTVDEPGMISALRVRRDIVALLDVTWPEPPAADSPLLHSPNIFYTRHIAGARGQEVHRMADLQLDEAARMDNGEALVYGVSLEQLAKMA